MLSAHYRQPLEWSESLIAQSRATLDRLYRFAHDDAVDGDIDQGVLDALADDLNTPLAISRLCALDDPATLRATAQLLGFISVGSDRWFRTFMGLTEAQGDSIERRVNARTDAKQRRDFAEADRIRDELVREGILLEDGPSGTSWRRA